MNKLYESCQYNGPYLSIVNPCENCPNTGLATNLPTADEYRDFIGHPYASSPREWSEPKYICPKCGGGMCRHESIVYASNPPRYEYKCNKRGNVEYQFG